MPAAVDHQVRRLDVAVQHPLLVCVLEGLGRLPAQAGRLAEERVSESADTADKVDDGSVRSLVREPRGYRPVGVSSPTAAELRRSGRRASGRR